MRSHGKKARLTRHACPAIAGALCRTMHVPVTHLRVPKPKGTARRLFQRLFRAAWLACHLTLPNHARGATAPLPVPAWRSRSSAFLDAGHLNRDLIHLIPRRLLPGPRFLRASRCHSAEIGSNPAYRCAPAFAISGVCHFEEGGGRSPFSHESEALAWESSCQW